MSKNSPRVLHTSKRCFYVPDKYGTEKLVQEALKRGEEEISKALGRQIKPIRFSLITNREGKEVGAYYIYTQEEDVFKLIAEANKFETDEEIENRKLAASTPAVSTPVAETSDASDSYESSGDAWDDTPAPATTVAKEKEKKEKKKSWADIEDEEEEEERKKTGAVKKVIKVEPKKKIKISKLYYDHEGSKRELIVFPCEVRENPNINPYSLFAPKMPGGITDEDIRKYFTPFVSNPKACDREGNSYPRVSRMRNGNVYVNFQPGTDDAFCAGRIAMKGRINGIFVMFREALVFNR